MHEHHLVGEYRELGRSYGGQLAERGRSLDTASPETLDPPPERLEFARECARHVEDHAPYLLDEIGGIAEEIGIDPELVGVVPLALDAKSGCSLVAVRDEYTDDTVFLGRNHDFFPSFRRYATLYRTEPADGLASVGCSCVYVGRSDGINDAGLAIGFAGVPPHEFEPGFTWQLAVRAVLDTCRSVEEAVEFLESIPHATNVNFLVADESGDLAVVGVSPERVTTTRPSEGLITVTRQFYAESMREYQSRDPSIEEFCDRTRAVEEWIAGRKRPITMEDLQTAMGDPKIGACWPVDADGNDPRSTIWSWTMDPANRVGYLAAGSPVETPYEPVEVTRQ